MRNRNYPVPTEDCHEPESSKNYEVRIQKVENGFIVEVGCKTFVLTTTEELVNNLELFYTDFEAAKKKFLVV